MPTLDARNAITARTALLENVLAKTLGHKEISIIDLDISRRLRAATRMHVRINFEVHVSDMTLERISSTGLLEGLQQMFEKEGLQLELHSASIEFETADPSSVSPVEEESFSPTTFAFAAAALVSVIMAVSLGVCVRHRRKSSNANSVKEFDIAVSSNMTNVTPIGATVVEAKVHSVASKDKLDGNNDDIESVSTNCDAQSVQSDALPSEEGVSSREPSLATITNL
jgi:hypothetical protein